MTLLILGVSAPYLFYRPYDHWETLRFLLQALVASTILAAFGLRWVSRRVAGQASGALVASILAVVIASTWVSWLASNQVFDMPEHEARHRVVGELVARVTPEHAVILALQHSGSVRYYAHPETLNWSHSRWSVHPHRTSDPGALGFHYSSRGSSAPRSLSASDPNASAGAV